MNAVKNGQKIDLKALGLDGDFTGVDMEEYMAQQEKKIEEMEKPWE